QPLVTYVHSGTLSSRHARYDLARANLSQRLPEIGDQVLYIFNADRVADESFRDAAGRALFGRGFDVAGCCRRASNGLYRAQVRRQMRVAQSRQERLHRIEAAVEREAEHTAKAGHLPARNVVILMRGQSGIEDLGDSCVRLKKARNLKRVFVLLTHAQVKGLHST